MNDLHITDLSAGYVLGALAPGERAAVDAHIAGCADCRADIGELLGVAGILPLACEQTPAPAGLKARILNAASVDVRAQQNIARRGAEAPRPSVVPRASGHIPAMWGWFAGAAAAAAIVLGGFAAHESGERLALQQQRDSLAADLAQARQSGALAQHQADAGHAVMAALASGTYWTAPAHQDRSGRMWRLSVMQPPVRGHNGMLVASVPEPPRGMAYQIWVKRSGTPHKAGMVMHGGMTMVDMPMPLQKGDMVAFSVEPMSGSAAPTSPYVMAILL
jgi:anti-sigma-K factor RskA